MNSSGIKRGLAFAATSALAITGLPFLASSAQADSLADQEGSATGVTLQAPESIASVENDGSESTVHLVATGGSSVQQVRFEFSRDGGTTWLPIATVSRNAGAFSTEWAPPVATYNTSIDVRAVALGSVGTEIGTPDANTVLVDPDADAIDIAYAPGASVGVFDQPYVTEGEDLQLGAVSGTTSDLAADPVLSFTSNAPGATATSEDVASEVQTGDTTRSYSAPVDFGTYVFDTTAPVVNEALILAAAEGEDAEPVAIYRQTISGVTVAVANSNVQGSATTDITVTVVDQNGNPVVGAQVVSEDAAVGAVSGTATEYTNSQGNAVFEGATGSANGSTYDFYVNTTDTDAYENNIDFRRSATVGNYTPAPTTLTLTSADGLAFDVNENDGDDLRARLLDQNGNPIANTTVAYSLAVDLFPPAAGAPTPNPAPTTGTVTTNAQGFADIPFTNKGEGVYTLSAYVNLDGTPGQGAGDLSAQNLVFKAGDANLVFDDAPVAPAGTTATYSATLTLDDGTPLPGRAVRFAYTSGGDDVVVAAQAAQPTGTTRISDTVAEDTTGANGAVSVALSDPANTPARSELDGSLDADTIANTIGNAQADAADIDVEFVTGDIAGTPTVTIDASVGTGKPGEVTAGELLVTEDNPATTNVVEATPVANTLITLTVDGDAFFTTAAGEPANPAAGDLQGDLVERGQTITVVTDALGEADFYIGVKRSEDFDDDGLATVDVTANADGATDTEDYPFSSENPLNGGEVVIELAADRFQDSTVLPLLPTTDSAAYEVMVTDQFGNPVDDEDVEIDIEGVGGPDTTVTTDFVDNAEFYVSSNTAGDSMPVGTWDAPVNDYTGAPVAPRTTSADIEGEGPEVEFYEVDFANSTYTLSQQGPDRVPVGTTVVMTYTALDQNGEGIEFDVDFFRTGPDEFGDGESANDVFTGEDGSASYIFQGATEGTATVTAIGSFTSGNAETVVPQSQVSDTVEFGGAVVDEPVAVTAIIAGEDNGGDRDVIRFQVDDEAEGATVRLFKIKGKKANRRLQEIRNDIVPQGGELTFNVADRNGNRVTRYVAKVGATDATLKAKSNTQKIR